MDTAMPARTATRLPGRSIGVESCVQGRSVSRGTIVILEEDCLRFLTFKPVDESRCAFGVRRIFKDRRVVDERLRSIQFSAKSKRHVRMLRAHVLAAEIDF